MKLDINYNNKLGEKLVGEIVQWLLHNVGEQEIDWSWQGYRIVISDISKDDAIIFKLKFGL